ncbi:MAG TPA: tetratricopeptide repeat protein [Gemmatimonadales bacterium]|nr:tetratricopeptide repeat protein [Gemmatimonadales bacterium]
MADEIKKLSSQLAQDPDSLVFLRLAEQLRHKGQLDAAHRVAVTGLERHPHLADAHDLYARILADKHDYERAFDEWDMALRIAPTHVGALKGLAFLYFKVGDVEQALAHLEAAQRAAPDDASIAQALALARGGHVPQETPGPPPATAPVDEPLPAAAQPLDEARVFAGLEGAEEGLLLLDASGRVLGGALKNAAGQDVTDAVAAYLAGVSQEAARTTKLLALGKWTGVAAEGRTGHVHLTAPTDDALLLVVRDRAVPMGRLAIIAQRAAGAARRWLAAHG